MKSLLNTLSNRRSRSCKRQFGYGSWNTRGWLKTRGIGLRDESWIRTDRRENRGIFRDQEWELLARWKWRMGRDCDEIRWEENKSRDIRVSWFLSERCGELGEDIGRLDIGKGRRWRVELRVRVEVNMKRRLLNRFFERGTERLWENKLMNWWMREKKGYKIL